jgi:flagellar hook-associated protein FlgK
VGSEGSFTQLTGWSVASENLADLNPAVTDGKIYIRVINTSTDAITREEITIDADQGGDTLTTIATAISGITGLTASVSSSRLNISADTNYEFDFLPGVLSADTSSMTSPPTISVSGIYTGSTNQTYTGKVIAGGTVGNTSGLQIQFEDGASQVVATVNVGSGYAAGDRIEIADGIFISVGPGTLTADEQFTIEALADSDTSGLLSAIGINTFFSGSSAANIAVCSEIANSPGRIATALGADMTDNTNAVRMAGVKDQTISSLNSMTIPEFYRRLVTDLGQQVYVKQIRQENTQVMVQNLASQQAEISGVNINDEAARMLLFEQMFTAMAKYLNTVQSSISALMEIT